MSSTWAAVIVPLKDKYSFPSSNSRPGDNQDLVRGGKSWSVHPHKPIRNLQLYASWGWLLNPGKKWHQKSVYVTLGTWVLPIGTPDWRHRCPSDQVVKLFVLVVCSWRFPPQNVTYKKASHTTTLFRILHKFVWLFRHLWLHRWNNGLDFSQVLVTARNGITEPPRCLTPCIWTLTPTRISCTSTLPWNLLATRYLLQTKLQWMNDTFSIKQYR